MHYAKCILKCNIIQILFIYLTIGSRSAGVAVIQFANSERAAIGPPVTEEGTNSAPETGVDAKTCLKGDKYLLLLSSNPGDFVKSTGTDNMNN